MKKKIIIVGVIIIILATLAASILLITNNKKRSIQDTVNIIQQEYSQATNKDNEQLAKDLAPITNLTEAEIKEDLDTILTEDQQEVMDDIEDIISAPAENSEVIVYEDGTISYKDQNGNIIVESPNETILNMTDEEIQADTKRIQSELEAIATGEKTEITPNPNQSGELIPSGTDNESESVSNTSNSLEDLIKQMEAMDQKGYVGSTTEELTQADREYIASQIQLDP